MKQNESGAIHYLVIGIVVLLGVVGYAGYRVISQNEKTSTENTTQASSTEESANTADSDRDSEGTAAESLYATFENYFYSFEYLKTWKLASTSTDKEAESRFCLYSPDATKEPSANSCPRTSADTFTSIQALNPSKSFSTGIEKGTYQTVDPEGEPITLDDGTTAYKFSFTASGVTQTSIRVPYPSGQWAEFLYTYSVTTHESDFMRLVNSIKLKHDATRTGVGG